MMILNKKQILISLLASPALWLLSYAPIASAQVCNLKQITPSISPKNFTFSEILNTDGVTITPIATAITINAVPGVVWTRCVYGQKWNPATEQCIGSPILLSWSEALQEADKMQGIIDTNVWRLPNIKELNAVLDLQCINPPYNLEVFPDTFASEAHGLWTSSPHVDNPTDNNNPIPKTNAWYIDLSQGKLNYRDIGNSVDTKNFVRFVR